MIPALEATGFFLAITAVLGFSTWAEGWLASSARSSEERPPDTTSSAAPDFAEPGTEPEVVLAA